PVAVAVQAGALPDHSCGTAPESHRVPSLAVARSVYESRIGVYRGAMPVMEGAHVRPVARLSSLVAFYSGYRYEGVRPGTHLGLPSPYLTIVLSLGAPTRTAAPGLAPTGFAALAGGMHTRAVAIEHDGDQYGIQLALTPEGARSLLGMPAAELTSQVVPLD